MHRSVDWPIGDIVVFTQAHGMDRYWVAPSEEERELAFWTRQGCPVARWREYREWGGFFPPHPDRLAADSVGEVLLYPEARKRQRSRRSRLR